MRGPFIAAALAAGLSVASAAAADGEDARARIAWVVTAEGGLSDAAAVDLSRDFLTAGWDVRRVAWDGGGAPLPEIRVPRGARAVIVAPDQAPFMPVAAGLRARGAAEVLVVGAACGVAPEGGVAMLSPEVADGPCPEVDLPALVGAGMAEGQFAAMEPLRLRGTFGPLRAAPARAAAAPVVIGGGAGAIGSAAPSGVVIGRIAPAAVSASSGGVALGSVRPVAFATGGATSLSIGAVAQPAALLAARAPDPGLPRPSIIVGRLPGQGDDPVDEGGSLAGEGVDVDGYEARERLRSTDPDGFARLVESGAFDPLPEALPAALQTALQRMGCYRLAIDGDWGNGSRGAVDRYYAQRGGSAPTREAQVVLFRDVILREDVTCPAPVAAAPRRAAPAATTTRRTTARAPARQAAPARTAPARTAPAPAQPTGRINPTFSGAFR